MSVPPRWMAPKMMPGQRRRQGACPSARRSAVKQKPRKNSSSAIGASTQTRSATATSAAVDPSTPSSSGRSSFSVMPSAAAQTTEKAKKPTQASSVQPTAGPRRGSRRPNLPGVAGAVEQAREQQRRADQREVLHVGPGDRDARRRVASTVSTPGELDDERDHADADDGDEQRAEHRRERRPERPARQRRRRSARRRRLGPPDALGQLGTRRQRRGTVGGGRRRTLDIGAAQARGRRARSARAMRPGCAGRARRPAARARAGRGPPRASRTGADPGRARALDVLAQVVADVPRALARPTPASASARSKMARSGLAAPSSAEATAASTSGASPVSASRSCSETVPVRHDDERDAGARAAPAARAARRDTAENASASSSAAVSSAAGAAAARAAAPAASPRRSGAQRGERAASRPRCRCAR